MDKIFVNEERLREFTNGQWWSNVSADDASENELVVMVPYAEYLKVQKLLHEAMPAVCAMVDIEQNKNEVFTHNPVLDRWSKLHDEASKVLKENP